MTIQVDFWHLVGLLLGFIGVLVAFGRIQLAQLDKHIDRFGQRMDRMEKDLADHKTSMPLQYQRREDAIRFETTLNHKLDATYAYLERMSDRLTKFIERTSEK
jgi:hypothetical protein